MGAGRRREEGRGPGNARATSPWIRRAVGVLIAGAATNGCSTLLRSDEAVFKSSGEVCTFLGEPTFLKAPTPMRSSIFGTDLAARGDTLIVSAVLESADAVAEPGTEGGLFCPGNDVKAVPPLGAGAIHVYDRDPGQEAPVARLTHGSDSPHVMPTDDLTSFFEYVILSTHPVAVNESWLAIGSAGEENFRGSARLYQRDQGSTETSEPALTLPGVEEGGLFGYSVALDGDLLVVGAPRTDGSVENTGAAFLYHLDSSIAGPPLSGAEQIAKVQPPGLLQKASFGAAIAISKEWIVITAPARGEEPDPGAAYAYRRDETPFGATPHLIPAPEGAHVFGASVALDGDWLAIGAPGNYAAGILAGSAHLYHVGSSGWEHVQSLDGGDDGGAMFGWTLAFLPEALLVGYPAASHRRAPPLEGYLGSVYAFERRASGVQQAPCILRAPNPDPCDGFGMAIAVGDPFVAIGASFEDGLQGGPGEPDVANGLRNSGAVYLYPRLTPGAARSNQEE